MSQAIIYATNDYRFTVTTLGQIWSGILVSSLTQLVLHKSSNRISLIITTMRRASEEAREFMVRKHGDSCLTIFEWQLSMEFPMEVLSPTGRYHVKHSNHFMKESSGS